VSVSETPPPAKRRRRNPAVPAKARDTFLEALSAGWSVVHAAQRAGVNKRRFYEVRDADEAFASAWEEALEEGTQVLENELHRRAVEGYDEETWDGKGNLIRRVRRYSPALLIFSLKARRPDVYRDQVQVNAGGQVTFVLDSLLDRARRLEAADTGEIMDAEIAELETPAEGEGS
jgi:hypothetical protein